MSAVNIKTGGEIWKTSIEKYPEMKNLQLEAKRAGDVMLLVGPELVAISDSDWETAWRMPVERVTGTTALAVTLDDEIYLTDGSTLTKMDPGSGKVIWREEFSNRAFRKITRSSQKLLVLLSGKQETTRRKRS